MKTLYLDLFSGVSGDMFVGALIDLGVDARQLERQLRKLKIGGWRMSAVRKQRSGISGIKFDVHLDEAPAHHPPHDGRDHHHDNSRNLARIKGLIARSRLSDWVKKKSLGVFQRLAQAEGKIHGVPAAKVHFHEVGAIDSILDIVGGCIGLELLGKPRILASQVTEGIGWVDCAHGRFPVPAPATLAILGARGIGVTQCEEPHELVTPTGAALLAELAESFGPMQNLVAEKIGIGLGTRQNKTRPNLLRAVLGQSSGIRSARAKVEEAPDWQTDHIAVLETNLDDINAEILGHFVEAALAAGALDVFYTPIQMKKNRPGVLLTVLCPDSDADKFSEMILRETSAFGVRRWRAERRKLKRQFARVQTKYGRIAVKTGSFNDNVLQATPEFESCRKAAWQAKVPLRRVYAAAHHAICKDKLCEF